MESTRGAGCILNGTHNQEGGVNNANAGTPKVPPRSMFSTYYIYTYTHMHAYDIQTCMKHTWHLLSARPRQSELQSGLAAHIGCG